MKYEDFYKEYDSKVFLTMTDMQGPLGLLAQLWGEEHFFVAFYDSPDLVKRALEKVTNSIIEIIEHYKNLFPGISSLFWPFKYTPPGIGAEISEDHIATISPDILEEFVLPCWNKISKHFNGLHIHSCGNFEHQISNLQKVHNLRSLNFSLCQNGSFAQGNSFEKMREALPETILIPAINFEGQNRFPTIVEYLEHILSVNEGNKKLYLTIQGTVEEKLIITYQKPEIMEKAYNVLEKYGIPRDAGG